MSRATLHEAWMVMDNHSSNKLKRILCMGLLRKACLVIRQAVVQQRHEVAALPRPDDGTQIRVTDWQDNARTLFAIDMQASAILRVKISCFYEDDGRPREADDLMQRLGVLRSELVETAQSLVTGTPIKEQLD